MPANKTDTDTPWTDPDDAPELTDDWFSKAALMSGESVVRRGGRPHGTTKELVTLRLDKAILSHFRAGGPGWQTRLNNALRDVLDAPSADAGPRP